MYKISVIIPVYNVEKYLKECLDSVINQTLKDIEIICVNDGSTDNSLDIIKEYAQNDNRIIVIDKKNAGLGAAYNSGLEVAKGEYIGFVEPDDYISLNMYENLFKHANSDVDIVKSDYYTVKNNIVSKSNSYYKYKNNVYKNYQVNEMILRHVSHWSGIYKQAFLKKYKISFHETCGASFQDTGFAVQVYTLARNIFITNEAYYY